MRKLGAFGLVLAVLCTLWFGWHWYGEPMTSTPDANLVPNITLPSPPTATPTRTNRVPETPRVGNQARAPKPEAGATIARAQAYVDTLTKKPDTALAVTKADHFVTGQQALSMQNRPPIQVRSLEQLRLDPKLAPGTPITVVRSVPEIELATPETLIAEAAGDLGREIRILIGDKVETLSIRDALAREAGKDDIHFQVVKETEYLERTTVRALLDQPQAVVLGRDGTSAASSDLDQALRVIEGSYRPDSARLGELLAGFMEVEEDSVFYVHSVHEGDTQGVWGIIHDGLIENFARGMAVRRGREIDRFRIDIPRDADERHNDKSSSFLGRLIDTKARTSAVYNFRAGRMTRNPDLVHPGSEIVIISFSPEELISIYEHFVAAQSHAG